MKTNKFLFGFVALVFVVAICNCLLTGSQSREYEFQPGQEMSLAKTYDEGELPAGASIDNVAYMGQTFITSGGDEIKLVAELSGGVIDINIKFANDTEKYKFQIPTSTDPVAEWEGFEIIPFLQGAKDGKYHFWLYIIEK